MTGPGTKDADGLYSVGVWEIDSVYQPTSGSHSRPHLHTRDGYWCPALVPPFVPTKKTAIYLVELSEAIRYEETFARFVAKHPADFPLIASAEPRTKPS